MLFRSVENPQTGTMKDEYKYSGTIEPKDTVDVTASMTGTVKAVNFKEGDKVNKGDVLFTIDTKDLENTIKTNKASLLQLMQVYSLLKLI